MDTVSHIIGFLTEYRFFLMAPLILITIFLFGKTRTTKPAYGGLAVLVLGFMLVNVIGGPQLNALFLEHYGTTAKAVVLEVKPTNSTYNEEPVFKYITSIKKPDGSTLETAFTTMSFNIYPRPAAGYSYPNPGIPFEVKYVPGAETNFVILSNTFSPYTQQQQCNQLLQQINASKIKYDFDPQQIELYRKAVEDILEADCLDNPALTNYYQSELEKLE